MYVFLSTRTTVKTYGPVGAPMVMVREDTDQMNKFNIQRAPTISEDGHLEDGHYQEICPDDRLE